MRNSISDKGWPVLDGVVIGVALGYDFVAEHECGVPYFRSQLGIPEKRFPLGVDDRTATKVPDNLRFYTYNYSFKTKRARKYQKMPAAILLLTNDFNPKLKPEPTTDQEAQEFAKWFGADFVTEPYDTWYKSERDDLSFCWSSHNGCILHVRGEENVARLKEVYEAFLRKDIALNFGGKFGFSVSPVSFFIKSKLTPAVFEAAMNADLHFKHLEESADKSGIAALLKKNGIRYYALSPSWSDGPDSDLVFWLNPERQDKYQYGYYRLDELQEWANGKGPVVDHKEIRDSLSDEQWRSYGGLCPVLLKKKVIKKAYDCRFVWLNKEEKKIGVKVRVMTGADCDLVSGVYPVEELLAKYGEAAEA